MRYIRRRQCSLKGPIYLCAVCVLVMAFAGAGPAKANPEQGRVVAGTVEIKPAGKTLGIHQKSDRAIINWGSFDIAKGETTQFFQPKATSIALNRVTSTGQASRIDGALKANGRIFVINPNGAVFGKAARVNVGSLVVSSADLDDADFMRGQDILSFSSPGREDAVIVNDGKIAIAESGLAVFVAPSVRNDGIIEGRASRILLAGGDVFAVDLYGDGLMNLAVQQQGGPRHLSVANGGRIVNDAGSVLMTAADADGLVSGVVNTSGHIRARGLGRKNGKIVLAGGDLDAVGTLDVSGDPRGGDGGFVETSASGRLNVEGLRVDAGATRGKAGTWLIDPEDIHIVADNAVLPPPGDSHISVLTLESALSNIILAATRDIFFEESVSLKHQGVGLSATAGRDLFMNGTGIATRGGAVELRAGNSLNLNRAMIVTQGGDVTLAAFNPDVRRDGAVFLFNSLVDAREGGKINVQAEVVEGGDNILKEGRSPVVLPEPPVIVDPPAAEPPPATEGEPTGAFNASRLLQKAAGTGTQSGGMGDGTSLLAGVMPLPELQDISPAAGGDDDAVNPVLCANSFLAGVFCE